MNNRNALIISKILSEITSYLLIENINQFSFSIEKNNEFYKAQLEILEIPPLILKRLSNALMSGRDSSLESYGWTLIGEGKLDFVGALIDEVTIKTKENKTIIIIVRNLL